MNLKPYFFGALASLFGLQSLAQSSLEAHKTALAYIHAPEIQQNAKIDYSKSIAKNTVFSSEFDVDEEWLIINEGEQGTWAIVTETSPNVSDFMGGPMQSATPDNGFGEFDGISFLLDGNVAPQNSILQYNGLIDCSTLDDVVVIFNQRA